MKEFFQNQFQTHLSGKFAMTCVLAILFTLPVSVFAQNQISGTVANEQDEPVYGAYVQVLGEKTVTTTAEDGSFSIQIEGSSATLKISHASFDSQEISVNAGNSPYKIVLNDFYLQSDKVIVHATRADASTPATFTDLSEEEIEKQNFGQDVPFLLDMTPSVTINSDAGAGVGYTGIRIRGTDVSRINVTINGIPLNDSESHGVYWVNTPDLASSTKSLQIQRGVGTSTNGSAAFGANINMQTSQFSQDAFAEYSGSVGSFNTLKNTLQFGSGLLENGWYMTGRLSAIKSDGYIDRSQSDLKSYYLEGGYFGKNTLIKFLTFGGLEETYQSWWGTPEARLNNDVDGMNFVADMNWYSDAQRDNLLNSGRTFNYYLYENEVDHYQQDHYQLHVSQTLNETTRLNAALHYTYGRGYYEQFKEYDDLQDYDIEPVETTSGTITNSDLIRRRWLDNHFLGTTFSLEKDFDNASVIWGGAWNKYDGDHFGEVTWVQYAPNIPKDYKYYDNNAVKTDFNSYLKVNYQINDQWAMYGDLQVRNIDYSANGPDHERVDYVPVEIDVDEAFMFFNPKAGLSYFPEKGGRAYLSYARANREPVRSDFIDNAGGTEPLPETLNNIEAGMELPLQKHKVFANVYYMGYNNQLVLTGALNDVGSPLRENVASSYRAGIEAGAEINLTEKFKWSFNTTLSRNKIKNYTEVLYDYGVNWDEYNVIENQYENVDLSFSPNLVGSSVFSYLPIKDLEISAISKYVGKQYLDNTENEARMIDAYFVNHFRVNYTLRPKFMKEIRLGLLVNNIFNELYEANGYTFGYSGGGIDVRENYYYPQAERNFLLSANFLF